MIKLNGNSLELLNIINVDIRTGVSGVYKNKNVKSSMWEYKQGKGNIILNCSLNSIDQADLEQKLAQLDEILGDGVLQIDNNYYCVSIVLGAANNLDFFKFNILFSFDGITNTGVYPQRPDAIAKTMSGNTVTVNFNKGLDSVLTELLCEDINLSTDGTSFSFQLPQFERDYAFKLRSKSIDGTYSDYTESIFFTTEVEPILVSAPTNVTVSSIIGKYITINFNKDPNALYIELLLDGQTYVSYEGTYSLKVANYDTLYTCKLRSKSPTENYSDYTEDYTFTSGSAVIPEAPASVVISNINQKDITITFTKGLNAVSTELECDGHTISTTETSITLQVSNYSTEYTYKLRSKSATDEYSTYTPGTTFTSGRQIIIPEKPLNVAAANVVSKNISIVYTTGENAVLTELLCDGMTYISTDGTFNITVAQNETAYAFKMRSKSSTGDYSDYTEDYIFTSGSDVIIPYVPSNVVVLVDQKNITINFDKGVDASLTELEIDEQTYNITGTSFVLQVSNYSTTYNYRLRSKSRTGDYSSCVDGTLTSGRQVIIPNAPTNQQVSVNGKTITITFAKGLNADITEIEVDGQIYAIANIQFIFDVSNYSTQYTYRFRSKSTTGDYSTYTADSTFISGVQPIIPSAPTNVVVSNISGKTITIDFSKSVDTNITEIEVDGNTYSTSGTQFTLDVASYNTQYTYRLRSKSTTGHYSTYTADSIFTSSVVIPGLPTNVVASNISGKTITISFDKGVNTDITELELDGNTFVTSGTQLVFDVSSFITQYTYKLRSKSVSANYSAYTADSTFTSGEQPVSNALNIIKIDNYNIISIMEVTNDIPSNTKNSMNYEFEIDYAYLGANNITRLSSSASYIDGVLYQ